MSVRRTIAGVPGLVPGWLPGEPGWVKRDALRVWVVGAGWWRLTRAGESDGKRVVLVTVVWWRVPVR